MRIKHNAPAWEQRKLGKLAGATFGGGTPKTSVSENWDGEIPWIQSSDLADGVIFGARIHKRITRTGLASSATKLVPAESIAIITRVGVGKLSYLDFPYATSQDFLSLSELRSEPWFTTYAIFKKLNNELHMVQGTSIKGITKEELLTKEIALPSIDEQTKIGALLRSLDTLITLHQRKLIIHEIALVSALRKRLQAQ